MPTFTLIASNTVGSGGAATVTFSSIPATYTDLVLLASPRGSVAEDGFSVRINNDSATNYEFLQINGSGSAVASSSGTVSSAAVGGRQPESGYTANVFGNNQFYFPNYAGSKNKAVAVDAVNENNATAARTQFTSDLYPQTTAISRLDAFPGSGAFVQYSSFYLYGISNA